MAEILEFMSSSILHFRPPGNASSIGPVSWVLTQHLFFPLFSVSPCENGISYRDMGNKWPYAARRRWVRARFNADRTALSDALTVSRSKDTPEILAPSTLICT